MDAPLAVREVDVPKQTEELPAVNDTVGLELTVSVTTAVEVHPLELVPVTV